MNARDRWHPRRRIIGCAGTNSSRARIGDRHHLLPRSAESLRDGLLTIVLIGVPDESCSGVSSFEVSSCQNSVEDGWNMRSIAQPDPLSFVFCPLSSKPQNQKPETRN